MPLRPNEEDRLFGLISVTVRATIKYEGGVSPDLIDDAVQTGSARSPAPARSLPRRMISTASAGPSNSPATRH